jgi:molybdopterin molybdotransferase
MESFFKVEKIENLYKYRSFFEKVSSEKIETKSSLNKVSAADIFTNEDIPGFARSTMDGFALNSKESFGASHLSPLFFKIKDKVVMGKIPDFSVNEGEAAAIGTGGMLPQGTDSVVMIEYTSEVSENEIEIFTSAAPYANTVKKDDDFKKGSLLFEKGTKISGKNIGTLAAAGIQEIEVYKKLKVGIISTGDEIEENEGNIKSGKIRDTNRHIISFLSLENDFKPVFYGISKDEIKDLEEKLNKAKSECDAVVISGGSSVGTRDITIDAINRLKDPEILIHGLALSPGKPAIIARTEKTPVFGLPGNPVSCFCVFFIAVLPFLRHMSGYKNPDTTPLVKAQLTRNIYSSPGRTDLVRVKLFNKNNIVYAEPLPGESGLTRPLAEACGLLEIPSNKEGGLKDESFFVHMI